MLKEGLIFNFRNGSLDLSQRTHIMGVLNVTPDSFSDGGKFFDPDEALRQAEKMIGDGADIIDVGGESTRPFSEPVEESTETERVVPVISAIAKRFKTVISIDTCRAAVAKASLDAGAQVINDVSALRFDPNMGKVAAAEKAGLVLMHMKGTPRNMQVNPEYSDVVSEIKAFLAHAVERARASGVNPGRILVDPGIGFGKRLEHNLTILRELSAFKEVGPPVLVGPSRKSFIGSILDAPVDRRLIGTVAAIVVSVMNGASVVRVHDVKEAREAVLIADAVVRHRVP
jgi:dihydropteroate synthase